VKKSFEFIDFSKPSYEVAPQLIGAHFFVNGVGGVIVEVEAYDQLDPASHTFAGLTNRNAAMFGPPGCAYVYRSYGIHWCLNFVCGAVGHGAGVLIRAIEPTLDIEAMRKRRNLQNERLLCAGPGRVGQALAISPHHNGLPLNELPFSLLPPAQSVSVVQGPRIGISKAIDVPWRFGMAQSLFLSRPFVK
jgi:DNA-3-methyladenine glycosylase